MKNLKSIVNLKAKKFKMG